MPLFPFPFLLFLASTVLPQLALEDSEDFTKLSIATMLFLYFGVLILILSSVAAFDAIGDSLCERLHGCQVQVHGGRIFNFSVDPYQSEKFSNETCA